MTSSGIEGTEYNSWQCNGRLGNQIIRGLAVSLIAKKFNLKVDYLYNNIIENIGINLFSGKNIYSNTLELNDNNYFCVLNSDTLNFNLNPNYSYFQTKEITNFLYNYLHNELIKLNIIEKNPFKSRYNTNNDLFIHIRLDDASQWNPGIDYYINTINNIKFDNLYISTDEKTHNIINTLTTLYKNAKLINYDEVTTFQFGSTCKNIILSHGSFSAVIGYLAFFSTIYYPEYDKSKHIWYGDMFSIDNWIKIIN